MNTEKSKRAAEIRTLIAKDALAGIASGKLEAASGTYFRVDVPSGACGTRFNKLLQDDGVSLKKVLGTMDTCTVCAIGAAFTATVISGKGRVKFNEVYDTDDPPRGRFEIDDDFMRETLRKYFSPEQLGLMESAFECSDYMDCEISYSSDAQLKAIKKLEGQAIDFGNAYDSDRERLEAIFKNIIENDGEFKP